MNYFIQPQGVNGNYFYNQDIYSGQYISQYSPDQCQSINIFILIPQVPYFNSPYCQQDSILTTNPYIMSGQPSQVPILPQAEFNFGFPNYLVPSQPPHEVKKSNNHKKGKEKRQNKHKSKHSKSKKSHNHKSKKPNTQPPPQIEPYCTYSVTGETYGEQKWYHCRTCGLTGNSGICEFCVKKCHVGHDVSFYKYSDIQRFYCDCPDHGNCRCLHQSENLQCTFDITKGKFVEQPMYECLDCEIEHICQNCAIKFHKEHTVRVTERSYGDVCYYYKQKNGDIRS